MVPSPPAAPDPTHPTGEQRYAVGIDLGGTKIEAIALDPRGNECWRQRIASPSHHYETLLDALHGLVTEARAHLPPGVPVGVGIGAPGSPQPDGRIKNANTTCLNGRTLAVDLSARLGLPAAVANDANCLALSEATDGAGTGAAVVFAAILGTGVGAGISVHGQVLQGPNGLAGEWGHNPLPWARPDDPRPACYCGQVGCIESLISGPGMARDHALSLALSDTVPHTLPEPLLHALPPTLRPARALALPQTAQAIAEAARQGDPEASDTLDRWLDRLARALASVINLLDPDVIVLGGGLSRIERLYRELPQRCRPWIFSAGSDDAVRTRVLPARHGDSSGVRGAAWLGARAGAPVLPRPGPPRA